MSYLSFLALFSILRYGMVWYGMVSRYIDEVSPFVSSSRSRKKTIIKSKLTPPKQEEASAPAYASSSSGSASPSPFPSIFATTGVSATVGGNLIGDAALCAA